MSALPHPEAPPPDTPVADESCHRRNPASEPRRERSGASPSGTVRLCLVDPAAKPDEIVTAAVCLITATYTEPGDRVMLAGPETPSVPTRQRRDRLVESVLRLGRGATTAPNRHPHHDHDPDATDGNLDNPAGSGSGSGLGPHRTPAAAPVANAPEHHPSAALAGPHTDGFALIITGWSDHPTEPSALAESVSTLAPSGTVVVLTHRSDQEQVRGSGSGRLTRAAAGVGLILTDRLALAHRPPSGRRPTAEQRRAIALGGHRRIHTTAHVFRRSTPLRETRHA